MSAPRRSTTNTYQYARVGIAPCAPGLVTDADDFIIPGTTFTAANGGAFTCPASGWLVFDAVVQPTHTPTITVNPVPTAALGDGVLVNAYLLPNGNAVHTTITLPDRTTFNQTIAVTGPVYTEAQAFADWTTTTVETRRRGRPAVPTAKTRDTQFFQGRFTTLNGSQGTFQGPWTLTAVDATSNGTPPPTGTLIGQPSFLWNDGSGFNGMGDDAFGVWRFPF